MGFNSGFKGLNPSYLLWSTLHPLRWRLTKYCVDLHSGAFITLYYDRSVAFSKSSTERSAIYCFLFQVPVSFLFLKSSSNCLRVFPRFPIAFYFSFHIICLQEAFPTQDATNPVGLPSFLLHAACSFRSSLCVVKTFLHFFYPISPTDFLHPFPASHFRTLNVFLICCPKCPRSITIQSYAPNIVFYWCLPKI